MFIDSVILIYILWIELDHVYFTLMYSGNNTFGSARWREKVLSNANKRDPTHDKLYEVKCFERKWHWCPLKMIMKGGYKEWKNLPFLKFLFVDWKKKKKKHQIRKY